MKVFFVFLVLFVNASGISAKNYYVSSSNGSDVNKGMSPNTAMKTLSKVNTISFVAGDSLLFKSGDEFVGQLILVDINGSIGRPIVVSNYGLGAKPVLSGDGFLSTILIQDSRFIHVSNLEIKNNGGPARPGQSTKLRYGIHVHNTHVDGAIFEHFVFDNLSFNNIYSTTLVNDNDQTGIHSNAINITGLKRDRNFPIRFKDVTIRHCYFTRTGRHATVFRGVKDLKIHDNLFEHVGGAGMVIGVDCTDIIVEHNITNYTGSNIDPRMAARGSGLWCYKTKNLVAQHNKFMHARGVKDSHGMHIDIGNRNVLYQYNLSLDNEGGFVEVLGSNVNVGYRYNISIADGWRKRKPQLGRIFWIGGWSGNPKNPIGSDSVFVYNNTVFIPDTIQPRIWIEKVTKQTRIYNNIIYASNGFSDVFIKNDPSNNDFDHNLWFGEIPAVDTDGEPYRGANNMVANPLFKQIEIIGEESVVLQVNSPARSAGKSLKDLKPSHAWDYFAKPSAKDYFGAAIELNRSPDIGAVGRKN